jgi:hypothetical protein
MLIGVDSTDDDTLAVDYTHSREVCQPLDSQLPSNGDTACPNQPDQPPTCRRQPQRRHRRSRHQTEPRRHPVRHHTHDGGDPYRPEGA